jgi:pyruvate ferredoxin oxidoreductase beta subunit
MKLREIRPVSDYLRLQDRFGHLLQDAPEAREELQHLEELAEHNIEIYGLRGTQPEPRDSEGSDTVRRGGLRWS